MTTDLFEWDEWKAKTLADDRWNALLDQAFGYPQGTSADVLAHIAAPRIFINGQQVPHD
jgi:hypothetical protein